MKKAKTILAGLVCLALTSCGSLGTTGSGSGMGDILGSVLGAVTNGQTIGNVLSSVIGLDKPTQAAGRTHRNVEVSSARCGLHL